MPDVADSGFGIVINFASGFYAEIIDCSPPGPAREPIDTSHATTPDGAMTFIPSDLIDYGELGVTLNFKADQAIPIDQPAEPVVMTFPSGTTWSFSGFLTGYEPEAPIDDRMTVQTTLKVSGKITINPAGSA